MKRVFTMLLAAVLIIACVLTVGCKKEEAKTFTVGFDAEFPPHGFVDENGDYVGFDLDLAAEVASRRGWELKLQPIEWAAKDMEIESGTIDCIWNGFTMNNRLDQYTWTDAYMDNSQIIVVKGDSGIATFADLAGKVVTAQADSAALNEINSDEYADLKASFKELVVCSQYNAAFMELEAGAVDAIAMDITAARYNIGQRGGNFVILDEIITEEQYGVGFKLGNTELRDQVQETLLEMVEDGTFKTISEKWFDGMDVCILGK
ncbi:amino acid ABC transporter substrate-binding protein [Christensenellaceae bacterium OttesenSCG-928-L17]|nr:amino acid ABC transporter substrate-binding protein [Christensenellaceae bacterium OttesenSCG-928-L17]